MKRRLTALVLASAMILTMVGCGSTTTESGSDASAASDNGEFVVNACIASEPETIDPGLINSVDGSTYTQHQFEGLMKYQETSDTVDESGQMYGSEVVCGQAKDYTVSDDELVYTFNLRDDIYWSDGEPVTANDFVYAWERLVDPATASDYGYILDGVVANASAIQAGEKDPSELGIVAVDDKTIEITLEAPCQYFLSLCGFSSLMPLRQDVVEGNDDWTNPENIVVNGPYIVSEWVHDSYIKMVPNEKYYDVANLGPDAIVWWLSDSETNILSSYQAGEYDFIESFPNDMIESLQESGDCYIDPYIGTYYLYLNCEKIADWRVRAAICLAIDRDNIVENVTQAGETPATGLVAAGVTDSTGADFAEGESSELGALYGGLQELYPDYDLSSYAGRCDLAKALYQEAVDDGAWNPDTTLVYNFNTSDAHKAIAEAVGADLESVLGMNITLENQEWATYTDGLSEHSFGIARMGWIADYDDASTYVELFTTGNSNNYGVYSDTAYDETITAAKAASGADRDALLRSAEESLFSEGGFPCAPLYFYTNKYCISDRVTNVYYTSLGYYFFTYAQQN